jgi:hypothetical protein
MRLTVAQSGYGTVVYHVYYVSKTSIIPERSRLPRSCRESSDCLLDLERQLRNRKHIVHADIEKDILWAFEANGQGGFVRGAPDISSLELDGQIEFRSTN